MDSRRKSRTKQPFDKAGLQRHIKEALLRNADSDRALRKLYPIVKFLFSPALLDADKIPKKPCMFVGNHSLFALDAMVFLPTMLCEVNRYLRALGDRFLWSERTEKLLLDTGTVLANPIVCDALMEAHCDILVYPGGARESVKPASQNYQLQWRTRSGFVRQAARHGYTIMPFGIVGPDEFYDHLIEGEDLLASPPVILLQKLGILKNIRTDIIPPIPRGIWGSLFPKPQHCYVQFGDPVDLSSFKGKRIGNKKILEIRDNVAQQIHSILGNLLKQSESEKSNDSSWRSLLKL